MQETPSTSDDVSLYLWLIETGALLLVATPVIAGVEAIYWLKFGHWPEWSPSALGWWNPEATGWAGVDQILQGLAATSIPWHSFLLSALCFGLSVITDPRRKPA